MAVPAIDDDNYSELRQSPRRRVLKGGIIAFNDRHCTLPCTVRDISDTGARLRAQNSISIPDHFELIIEIDGFETECGVMWRRGSDVGVRFIGQRHNTRPRRTQVVAAVVPSTLPHLRKQRATSSPPTDVDHSADRNVEQLTTWSPLKIGSRCDAFLALLVTLQPETVRLCTLVAVSTQIANALTTGPHNVSGRALITYFPRESAVLLTGGFRVSRWYFATDLDCKLTAFQRVLADVKGLTLSAAQSGLLWQPLSCCELQQLSIAWQAASRAGHDLMVELDRMLSTCGITGATDEHSQFLALLKASASGSHSLIKENGDVRMPRWAEKRGFERKQLRAPALLVSKRQRRSVIVRDVSVTGLGLECDAGLPIGSHVDVEIGTALRVSGCVVWSENRRSGIQLDTPLHGDDPLMAFCSKFSVATT